MTAAPSRRIDLDTARGILDAPRPTRVNVVTVYRDLDPERAEDPARRLGRPGRARELIEEARSRLTDDTQRTLADQLHAEIGP